MGATAAGWMAAAVLVLGSTAAATVPLVRPVSTPVSVPAVALPPDVSAPPAGPPAGPPVPAGAGERRPPLPGRPVRPFEAPAHDYGPGHRGVDLPAAPGAAVVAPAAGVVTFAGPVAGRGVLVVTHADATLTSLEPVTATVAVGTAVGAGRALAVVQAAPRHGGCPTVEACLHWGVRVDGRYVDPWWWLGRAGPVRLLPATGAP